MNALLDQKRVLADVTIRTSIHSNPDTMFNIAVNEKTTKYETMARELGCTFIPLVFEAFGGFSNLIETQFITLLKCANGAGAHISNDSIIRDMRRKISVAIHRFNAMAMIRGAHDSRRYVEAG